MPLDGPQWRCLATRIKDDEGKTYFVQIWKSHHSFMDGVSGMALTASSTKEYKRDYFIAGKDATFWQELMVKVSIIFYIPMIVMDTIYSNKDKNLITSGKSLMKGNLSVSSSRNLQTQDIKDLSKKCGITVNDVLMCATSSAIN